MKEFENTICGYLELARSYVSCGAMNPLIMNSVERDIRSLDLNNLLKVLSANGLWHLMSHEEVVAAVREMPQLFRDGCFPLPVEETEEDKTVYRVAGKYVRFSIGDNAELIVEPVKIRSTSVIDYVPV